MVVGEVLTCGQHPNADRLRVTTVNVGGDAPLNIVCGAPNVAAGQKVIVATIGSTWRCSHHKCTVCSRRASAAGGMLFRCTECPKAFCEDCLPGEARVINDSPRFKKLGSTNRASSARVELTRWIGSS